MELRRFTISIPDQLETALDEAKRKFYYRNTRSQMIRDLIVRGLAVQKADAAHADCHRTA